MWAVALTMGFVGSLHCIGMCSPLALAASNLTPSMLKNRILYNTGRIFTYGIIGAIFTGTGSALSLAGFQNLISIGLGLLLMTLGLAGVGGVKIPFITRGLQQLTSFLKFHFAAYFKRKSSASVVVLGALNGMLPCGLTFIAFTYCLTLQGPLDGFNFMVLFGAGTLPAMLGLTSVFAMTIRRFNMNFQKVNARLLMVAGLLLIARVLFAAGVQAHKAGERMIDIVLCR